MSAPERLGRYLITGVVGEGAMGVVYRAFDPVIGRTVALKTLPRQRRPRRDADAPAGDPDLRARFRHEARAGGRLAHPGIVAVHEYAEQDGIAFIVMEHVEGHNLSQWLARRPRLPEPAVVQVLDQLLDALGAAHAAGVWHRDIKPSNVIVAPGGRLKLTDFGIARFADQASPGDEALVGSPGYIAPEQYLGDPVDHRADLFSAGVLLHRLLAGHAPFAGTPEEAERRTLSEPVPPLDDPAVEARYGAVLRRALAKAPAARFPSASAFRGALRQAAGWPPIAGPADAHAFHPGAAGSWPAATAPGPVASTQPTAPASPGAPAVAPFSPEAWDDLPSASSASLAAPVPMPMPMPGAPRPAGTAARTRTEERDRLPSAAIGHALRVLTGHLGADARAVIKGAAGRARSTEELHALILAGSGEGVNRRLLRRQLQRGPHGR